MEIFKQTNFDFLGKKWPFIWLSLALTLAGVISLFVKGGPRYGIDFTGGALIDVAFLHRPSTQDIRTAVRKSGPGEVQVQEVSGTQEVLIQTGLQDETALNNFRTGVVSALNNAFNPNQGKLDVNSATASQIADRLRDPLAKGGVSVSEDQLQKLASSITDYRDTKRSGLIPSISDLSNVPGVTTQQLNVLQQELAPGSFAIRNVEVVGPRIGADLRQAAVWTVLAALGAMLIYIAFRFEWIYGVAAVIAVFHDTIITIGLLSIFDKKIDLTVIAALLTLVGYSMNDTIVTFDRIRENLKLQRRGTFPEIVNASINQTLSRTVLTSGLTLLTALSLLIFGGQVLNGFSFTLVVGIIVGTYSSIFIASPILVFWRNYAEQRKRKGTPAAAPVSRPSTAPEPAKPGRR